MPNDLSLYRAHFWWEKWPVAKGLKKREGKRVEKSSQRMKRRGYPNSVAS